MNIKIFNTILNFKNEFEFKKDGIILEKDIHEYTNYTDDNDRKYHDAEVLTTIMANLGGDCLEIGTSSGHGSYKLATNTKGKVYTLNALPEQISGNFITYTPPKNKIGSYLIENNIKNFQQIYADSMTWIIPNYIQNLSLVFIDGCHDTNYVYSDSKKTFNKIKKGGFIIWHDFNPEYRNNPNFSWINSCMNGVEKFCTEMKIEKVFHLKNSYMGFAKKN